VAAAGPQGTHLVLQLAKPVQLKLKEWYAALPPCLRMDAPPPPSSPHSTKERLSSTGFLHLAYFATEITLHRRIIRSLAPTSSSSPSSTTHIKTEGAQPAPQLEPYIHHICRSAAKTRLISAMDFVNRLTTSHLRAFWYFASKTNFALIGTFGSLLWATAPGREEADWYRRRLGEYRWTLGVSCKSGSGSGGLTRFAMGMLDTSTGLLKGLPEKPALSRVASEGESLASASGMGGRRTFTAGSLPVSVSVGTGFSIGGRRREDGFALGNNGNGNGNGNGARNGAANSDDGVGMHSGLVSPSTSVSSSTDSRGGYDGYMISQPRFVEEDY